MVTEHNPEDVCICPVPRVLREAAAVYTESVSLHAFLMISMLFFRPTVPSIWKHVTRRPTARQRLDNHVAETDSW
jgi:hypothetical protein